MCYVCARDISAWASSPGATHMVLLCAPNGRRGMHLRDLACTYCIHLLAPAAEQPWHAHPPDSTADSTLRSSQADSHPSTDRALCCLTSEAERDSVHSTRYGRRRKHCASANGGFLDCGLFPVHVIRWLSRVGPTLHARPAMKQPTAP